MSTETLHFRVGADMGIILMNIAHEHLIYDNDFEKAVSTYTESFGGECPEDLVMQLLTGDMIILVDEDRQEFQVVPRGEFPHLDHLYPKLDVVEYAEKIQNEIDKRCADLKEGLNSLVRKFDGNHYIGFNFSAEAVMQYIYGNDEEMIAEIRDDYELQQWQLLIKIAYDFIKTSMKKADVIRKLSRDMETPLEIQTYRLNEIARALQKIAELDFDPIDNDIKSYMEATQEIQKTLDNGIMPVDILDNWSAGWLSPEGEYYALNGEIANMLHIQIADALQEQGIIPKTDEHGMEQNPDSWLEQNGWVRIHADNVQFAGNLNQKLGKPNVRLTEKQITAIRDYITNCWQCQIKAGWRRERTSIGMFISLAMKDPIALNKKYFDYD